LRILKNQNLTLFLALSKISLRSEPLETASIPG